MPRSHSPRRLIAPCLVAGAALALTAAAPGAEEAAWTRVDHDDLRGGGHVVYVNDIVPADGAGNPWLAVGYVVDSDGRRAPSAWASNDGVTWRRFTMSSTGSAEERDGPFYVARRGNVAVAIGNRFDGELRSAAWSSTAPATWRAVTTPTDGLRTYAGQIDAVDAGPAGFFAAGVRHGPVSSLVMVFHSDEGGSWRVREGLSTQPGEGFQPLAMSANDKRLVIVGDTATADADGRIWVVENHNWRTVDPAPLGLAGPGLQQVAGIAWDPALGYVAGGMTMSAGVEVPTLWTSPDAVAWKRLPPLETGNPGAVHEVVTTPGGFLAAGNSDSGPRLWRSSNGQEWTAVTSPSAPSEGGVSVRVATDGAKIVITATGQYGSQMFQRSPEGWKRADTGTAFPRPTPVAAELRGVAAAGRRLVAVGNDGHGKPLLMLSRSPGAWRKVPFADSAARFEAVTSTRGVFTIAGWRLVRGRARLALWTSRGGTSWRRLGGTQSVPVGAFVDIAPDGASLVATALEGTSRGLVTSVWTRTRGVWRSAKILGPGEAKAVCVGPHGATVVATIGVGPRSRVTSWSRGADGRWSTESELVAVGATAEQCTDGPGGTVIAGADENGAAVAWRRPRQGLPWRSAIIDATSAPSVVGDVIRDGSGYLATGTSGGRGQSDLAVWRSADGVRWTHLGGTEPVFLEPGFQIGLGITEARGRIVVVGRHGAGNAGLWVGTP